MPVSSVEQREKSEIELLNVDAKHPGARFLIHHGWEPQGEPTSPFVKWVDPAAPKEGKTEKVVRIVPHRDGETPDKRPKYTDRPVMHKDQNGATVPVEQIHITFPGREYSTNEAIVIQRERNVEERKKAKKEDKKEPAPAG